LKIPFLGQAYQTRTAVAASQTAINIFPELTEGNSDEVGGFLGTPGLSLVFQGVVAEVRGIHVARDGFLYAVIGSTVYRIASDFTSTTLGTLPNSAGRVSITSNETQVAFAHQSGWHWVAFTGTAIAAVTGAPSSSILTEQDQYALFTTSNGGLFGITSVGDLSTIDPLDVADAEGDPDNLIGILSDHREVWLGGTKTIEIWSDTGAALFPFERQPGGFIEMGLAAGRSFTKLDGSVWWLGADSNGKGIVYRSSGYTPIRISTHAIEYAINQYSDISDAIGLSYQEEGHNFYVLTFPTGDATWVYDTAAKGWHQRAWLDPNGLLHRHRTNCYATFNGKHLVGDWQNGRIYQMSLDVYTDNGDEIYRERAFDLPEYENQRIRLDKLQVFATIGDGASPTDNSAVKMWLQVSRDSGRTYGYQRIISTGAIGQTRARAIWRRLGTARNPVIRVATTMANRIQWVSAFLDGEVLSE
jgi:hypothetical protein